MTGLSFVLLASNTDDFLKAKIVTNIESSSADLKVSNSTIWIHTLLLICIHPLGLNMLKRVDLSENHLY